MKSTHTMYPYSASLNWWYISQRPVQHFHDTSACIVLELLTEVFELDCMVAPPRCTCVLMSINGYVVTVHSVC